MQFYSSLFFSQIFYTPTIDKEPCFWSEWQDLNLRHPGPKETYTDFLRDFHDFSMLFSPKTMLSGALVATVST